MDRKNKALQFIKEHKLVILLSAIFIASIIILFSRSSLKINIMNGGLTVNVDASTADNISQNNNRIIYDAKWDENNQIDFSLAGATVYKDLGIIPYGMYYLHVDYDTTYDTSNDNIPITNLSFAGKNLDKYQMEICNLYDYKKWVETPLWINSIQGSEDMRLNIGYSGYGKTVIKSLYLVESKLWKIGFLLTELFIFTLVSVLYYRFKKSEPEERIKMILLIGLIIFVSFPAFIGSSRAYYIELHDYWFHANRIASIANELRYGNFPAMYQSDALNGYGYVALIMYGDIFLYPAAIMHLLGYTIPACYNIYIILINICTIGIAYYSFISIFKEKKYATLGTVLYVLSAYRLGNIYIRAAVGEYTAMAFLPLVMAGFYKIYFDNKKSKLRDTIPLILGISGIIQSHVLTMEMLVGFIFVFVVIFFRQTIANILVLIEAAILAILVNASFIVPFLDTIKQGLIVSAGSDSLNIQDTGINLPQLFGVFISNAGTDIKYTTKSEMPLSLGLPLVLGVILYFVVCSYKDTWEMTEEDNIIYSLVKVVFGFSMLAIALSSIYFPWKDLAYKENKIIILFTSLQFAWRYLTFANIFLTLVTIYSVKMLDKNGIRTIKKWEIRNKSAIILVISVIVVSGHFFAGFIDKADAMNNISASANISMDNLYLPIGMDNSKKYETSVYCETENAAEIVLAQTDAKNNKIYAVNSVSQDTMVSFPVAYYDYLTVYDINTGEKFDTFKGYNQRLSVNLKKDYTGNLIVTYRMRKLWTVSYFVSIVSIIVLLIIGKRKNRN